MKWMAMGRHAGPVGSITTSSRVSSGAPSRAACSSSSRLSRRVLALRHQLGGLERQVGRPHWQATDRLLLAAISRALPRPAWRSLLPRPETLLRWHRELVRRKWAAYGRRPRRQRPVLHSELHELIVKLAEQNPRWGYRRIQGELRKLGHRCSHWTVRKVLRRHGLPPAPRRSQRSWREFVHQHAGQILACDSSPWTQSG